MKIAIMLFEDVDLLDSGGPYEVFLTASRLVARDGGDSPFDVITFTTDGQPITAYGGLGLIPSSTLQDALSADVLIVPGTIDIELAIANRPLIDAISAFSHQAGSDHVVASVCTGAFLLAEAGLLAGSQWSTHFEDMELLAKRFNLAPGKSDVRWVDNGSVVTAAGLSTGIDMALHLVGRFSGLELAQRTAKQIEYQWKP